MQTSITDGWHTLTSEPCNVIAVWLKMLPTRECKKILYGRSWSLLWLVKKMRRSLLLLMVLMFIRLLSLLRGASFLCWWDHWSLPSEPELETAVEWCAHEPLQPDGNIPSWMWQTSPILKINSAFSHGLIRNWRKINYICATVWLTVNSFGQQYNVKKQDMSDNGFICDWFWSFHGFCLQ